MNFHFIRVKLLGQSIDEHNRLSTRIQALKHLATQQPRLLEKVNKELLYVLIDEAVLRCPSWQQAAPQEQRKMLKLMERDFTKMNLDINNHNEFNRALGEIGFKVNAYLSQHLSLIEI